MLTLTCSFTDRTLQSQFIFLASALNSRQTYNGNFLGVQIFSSIFQPTNLTVIASDMTSVSWSFHLLIC